MTFVFSADGHIVEPNDLFSEGLPPSLRKFGLHAEKDGDFILSKAGDKVLQRVPIERGAPRIGPDGEPFGRPDRRGNREIEYRLKDMALDGVDAEIVFPSLGLTAYMIENAEAELATAQVYNDWLHGLLKDHTRHFVRCGILPVRDFAQTVAEMERLAALGFTSAMLPSLIERDSGLPAYTRDAWDPVFDAAQRLGIVFALHTGTGRNDVRSFRGAGGAVMNYMVQATDGMITIGAMVAGGLLDRFPGAKVCVIEGGASWLAALAERMDEVYEAHETFVRPKLSLLPHEIIARQVACSFQTDRACIMSRSVTGTSALLWGADYPHHEGTFPRSREVIAHLFDGIDISEREKADIVGGNAARLFRLNHPEFAVA
ncbi:amidohydrolase family protein [Novosphingobium sp. PhB165]|uniref:amidohydrolase family protein n=1 Tax=Novosphingobium sp. PhB165 TaxID=2485105 RepID=UPI00104414B5|nr:amidohydrolase family protein [Novosphingobium sp. PhB165]TCM20469.1 amidohydrolase family protein [Novosphingobium sp. PhB165]